MRGVDRPVRTQPGSRTGPSRTGRRHPAAGSRTASAREIPAGRWSPGPRLSLIGRILRRLGMIVAPVVLLTGLAALVVYVRLQQGPVSLKFMAGPIEQGISAELKGLTAKVDDAVLQSGEHGDYEFRLVNLRLLEADGSVVASAPVAAVTLDYARLAALEVLPRRVDLIEPKLAVTYSERGGLELSFSDEGMAQLGPSPGPGAPAEAATRAAQPMPGEAVPAMLRKLDLARVISGFTARARRKQDATGSLREIGLRNAVVVVDYEGTRSRWKVAELAVDLDHGRNRSVISAVARIESDRGPWSLSLLTEDSAKTGKVMVKASIRDLVPSALGRAIPRLALLGALDLPVAANASIDLLSSGDLTGADIALELGRGLIDLGPSVTAPMLIDAGLVTLNYDAAQRRLSMAPSTVKWGESQVTLTGILSSDPSVTAASGWPFEIRSVSGTLAAEEFQVPAVALDALALTGRLLPLENRIELTSVTAKAAGGEMVLAGDVIAGDGPRKGVRLDGHFGPGDASTVKALWPRMIAPRARDWFGMHASSGVLREGKVSFASGSFAGPDAVMGRGNIPETIRMEMSGENIVMVPMKGGPPLHAPAVTATVRNHELEIALPDATLVTGAAPGAGVGLKQGRFWVKDIDEPLPVADVTFRAQSPLGPALDALRQFRFAGADKLALPSDKLQGKFDGELAIRMPLLPEVEPETVSMIGKAKITEMKSKEKIGIVNVQSGSVDVQFAEHETSARGEVILNGVLAKIDWRRQTGPDAGAPAPLSITANLDSSDRRQLGIDVNDLIEGDVPVAVTFEAPEGQEPVIRVTADLTPADLAIRPLAWKKPRGRPARLTFDVASGTAHKTELRNFKVTGDDIAIEGSVGMSADQKLQEFSFPAFSLHTVSRLQVSGKRNQRDIWDVKAAGTTFDGKDFFRSLFTVGGTPSRSAAGRKGGVDLYVTIDNVLGHSDVALRNFSMRLSRRGDELTALDARGTLDGGRGLIAILQPDPRGASKIIADTMDAGQALRLVGFYPNMQGGRGRIDVNLAGRGAAEKTGVIIIEDFKVLGDPIISEVVSSADGGSPAISAVPGQRRVVREVFQFDRMRLPFSVGHGQFAIEDSYLRGPILGATLRGKVDYGAQRVNLGGTYIPLQGLNNALGGIPVLGQILSGSRGEGIFGIEFAVQGPMSNPQVVVNPLSLVAPGIFREVFQMSNPSTSVQPRVPSPADVPVNKRVRASSSGGVYEEPETVDGWSSDTVVPTKRN